ITFYFAGTSAVWAPPSSAMTSVMPSPSPPPKSPACRRPSSTTSHPRNTLPSSPLPRLSHVRPRHWHSWWNPHSLELQLLLAAKLHISPLLPLCHPLLNLLKQNFHPHQHLR